MPKGHKFNIEKVIDMIKKLLSITMLLTSATSLFAYENRVNLQIGESAYISDIRHAEIVTCHASALGTCTMEYSNSDYIVKIDDKLIFETFSYELALKRIKSLRENKLCR